MEQLYFLSIFLDTRRKKDNQKYPVKLRVYQPPTKITKLYYTKFEYTKKEFESIWKTTKPRQENNAPRLKLQTVLNNADEVAGKLNPFSFEQFEKKFLRTSGDGGNVFYQYAQCIKTLKENNQLGTASNYEMSLQSLKNFLIFLKGKEPSKLFFTEISPTWLNKYEKYMLNKLHRSSTTVSMYLRALRTVFNKAISDKEIEPELYPFGKNKYQVPAVQNVKKALQKEQLNTLFNSVPQTPEQEKAKDFWFFSFSCNGMNIKDIALLRWENLYEDKLIFYRAKTINTAKANLKPITVYITDHAKYVIEKYGNPKRSPKKLMFSILSDEQDEEIRFARIKNFTRFINQNLKLLAANNGLTDEISTYWARHSFATQAIRLGKTHEWVGESIGHSDPRSTKSYFAGFEDEAKRAFMKTMMNFKPSPKRKKAAPTVKK